MDELVKARLESLLQLVREHGLLELSIDTEGFKLTLKTDPHQVRARGGSAASAPLAPGRVQPAPSASQAPSEAAMIVVRSPLLGVFYRRPSPDAPACVEVGEVVETGQVVGLVEAMKIFNEIVAECPGRVARLLAHDGELVQVGEALVELEPIGEEDSELLVASDR